jgi:uncharacterized caspase-like protein
VGINDYREITPLQKAVGDAEALKVTLERLGFSVDLVLNADRREFNCAVSAFQTSLDPGDTALVHFSGHGVEIDGQNYLLPADIPGPQSGQQDFSLGGTRGLARVDAPAGRFIFYSAGYQQTALDRLNDADEEPTSVYTRVLTKKLAEPGKQLADLAREVRSEVETLAKSADHVQRALPIMTSSLGSSFSTRPVPKRLRPRRMPLYPNSRRPRKSHR